MRYIREILFTISFVLILASSRSLFAQVNIDITRGRVEPMPVAVTIFSGMDSVSNQFGAEVSQVIANDLERSGLFRPIDSGAFLESLTSLDVLPRFGDWRAINAQALVQGKVELVKAGEVKISFRLWDVFGGQQLIGKVLNTQTKNSRRVAHIIADNIYSQITGEQGYFDTRIVYVSESGPKTRRIKRLAIMDQDSFDHRFLTDGSALVLTPRFSPTSQSITYLSYFNNIPRVYLLNLDNGRREILGDFPGMTYAPRFSPSGNEIIFSMASDGNSDIYKQTLVSRRTSRLTDHPAIDTSPSFSPDGKMVTFNSDRGGSQQIYIMKSDGSGPRRISFSKGRYATPVWSPRGDLIAFTRMSDGLFYIGVMDPDGSGERLLAQGYLVESPTWAPNGRVLSYYAQSRVNADGSGGKAQLFSIDLTGFNQRSLITPMDGSDPAWSSLIR